MRLTEAVLAALRGDGELGRLIKASLRDKIDDESRVSTVVQAAGALEPILADAVRKRPSRLGELGLKSANLLAELAAEDEHSTSRLARLAAGKTVGIAFVDVAGFTTYTARRGDDAAIALLTRLDALVDDAVVVGKGEVVKRFGDGYLLAFPSASQAVRAVLALDERVGDAGGLVGARLRIAVHAGEPLVEGDDLLGHDVNITARLLDACAPGEVVVSDAAKEMAVKRLRSVVFENARDAKVRGLALRVKVWNARRGPVTGGRR